MITDIPQPSIARRPRWRSLLLLALVLLPLLWPVQQLAERYYREKLLERNSQTLDLFVANLLGTLQRYEVLPALLGDLPALRAALAAPQDDTRLKHANQLLKVIADTVHDENGGLTIRGHTDALPWRRGGGNNWSLSAGRAEATRQAMLRAGIAENRFFRIEGVADRELLVRDNPHDPRNRRISILMTR